MADLCLYGCFVLCVYTPRSPAECERGDRSCTCVCAEPKPSPLKQNECGDLQAFLCLQSSLDGGPKWSRVVWYSRKIRLQCEIPGSKLYPDFMKAALERKMPPDLAMLEPTNGSSQFNFTPKWQWWFNDQPIKSDRIDQNGSVEVRGKKAEGIYACALRGPTGTVRGYDTKLHLASLGSAFKSNPRDTAVEAGQPILLTCSIESSPPANITWEKDGAAIQFGRRYHALTQGQLLITETYRHDAGRYRCMATNAFVNITKKRWSDPAMLSVEDKRVRIDPFFLDVKDPRIVLMEGENTQLPCILTAKPKVKISWTLVKESDGARSSFGSDPLLTVGPVKSEDAGTYVCQVDGTDMKMEYNIRVIVPPKLIQRPNKLTMQPAGIARFNCNATGNPKPKITWLKDGKVLPIENHVRLVNSNGGEPTLLISRISNTDAGVYQCVAENEGGVDSDWAVLTVTGSNPGPAPKGLTCYPLSPTKVKLVWEKQRTDFVAYTIHRKKPQTLENTQVASTPSYVYTNLEPFQLYNFSVRSYTNTTPSALSPDVQCSGQGVPITVTAISDGKANIFWAKLNATELRLQGRNINQEIDRDIKLAGNTTNYTSNDLVLNSEYEVRLLASLDGKWPEVYLDFVPWTLLSTGLVDETPPNESCGIPKDVTYENLKARSVSITWTCSGATRYQICYKTFQPILLERCINTDLEYADLTLEPDTEYQITVAVHGAQKSVPLVLKTPVEKDLDKVTNLNCRWNDSNLIISWAFYVANKSADEDSASALETFDDMTTTTPPPVPSDNVTRRFTVTYSQNLTMPWNEWEVVNVSNVTELTIHNLKPIQTYVLVCAGFLTGKSNLSPITQNPVCSTQTVQPPPVARNNIVYFVGVACAFAFLIMGIAAMLWRRRKTRTDLPVMRQSELASNDSVGNWDNVELKSTTSSYRNGGNGRNVDEPLLNGYIDNPATRNPLPNGTAFSDVLDVSRRPDVTLTSLLSASPSTPRKARDDNMNCRTMAIATSTPT